MRVVVDANVWVSGLIVPGGPPGRILAAIESGSVRAVASWSLAEEILDVLRRPRVAKYLVRRPDLEQVRRLLQPLLPDVEIDLSLRDLDDRAVVASAIAARADAIVTGDGDLLGDAGLRRLLRERGIEVLSPRELPDRIGAG